MCFTCSILENLSIIILQPPPPTLPPSTILNIYIFIHNILSNSSVVFYMFPYLQFHRLCYSCTLNPPPPLPSSTPFQPDSLLHTIINYVILNISVVFYMFQPCILNCYRPQTTSPHIQPPIHHPNYHIPPHKSFLLHILINNITSNNIVVLYMLYT